MWGVPAAAADLQLAASAAGAPRKKKMREEEKAPEMSHIEEEEEAEEGGGSCGGGDDGDVSMNHGGEVGWCQLVASVVTAASSGGAGGGGGGVLTVLGGKASCRRKFAVSVQLLDAQGRVLPRDLAIAASVVFAHDRSAVPPPADSATSEPPLFTTFNGVEFPAHDNPTRMIAGRASFKLALSLLSSKFDNRLFSVRFTPLTSPPICAPCFSCPIRSISRKRASSSSASSSSMHSLVVAAAAVQPPPPPPPPLLLHRHQHSPDHSSSDGPSRFRTQSSHCKPLRSGCGCDPTNPPPPICQLRPLPEEVEEGMAALGIPASHNIDPLLLPSSRTEHAVAVIHAPNPPAIRSPNSGFSLATASARQQLTPSPVGSCSPNSASESCTADHHHFHRYLHNHSLLNMQTQPQLQNTNRICHCGGGTVAAAAAAHRRPFSAPSPPVSCAAAAATARPLRPQASRLSPVGHASFLNQTQAGVAHPSRLQNGVGRGDDAMNQDGSGPLQQAGEGLRLMGALEHLWRAMEMATGKPKGEESEGRRRKKRRLRRREAESGESAMMIATDRARSEVEEQERALQMLELSLVEVSRELQKRKEEVKAKRHHLLLQQQQQSRPEEKDEEDDEVDENEDDDDDEEEEEEQEEEAEAQAHPEQEEEEDARHGGCFFFSPSSTSWLNSCIPPAAIGTKLAHL